MTVGIPDEERAKTIKMVIEATAHLVIFHMVDRGSRLPGNDERRDWGSRGVHAGRLAVIARPAG